MTTRKPDPANPDDDIRDETLADDADLPEGDSLPDDDGGPDRDDDLDDAGLEDDGPEDDGLSMMPDVEAAPSVPLDRQTTGFFAVIGAPNAGKSTLVNRLVGSKVSIVSPKVQTTRSRIIGIAMHGNAQLVFIDTPGIFKPKRRLDKAMVQAAWSGAGDADGVVMMIDAKRGINDEVRLIVDGLKAEGRRAWAVLNKVDLVARSALLPMAAEVDALGVFDRIFMISAENGSGVTDLADALAAIARPGRWMYPEDQTSDVQVRFLASEIVREKLFLSLHEELPYALTVETEAWTEKPDGSARIDQVVYVQRESHRKIVLGAGGRTIKHVGSSARAELEQVLERRIHLFLFVKVREAWADDPERYREMNLDFPR
ncbi:MULTISPECIES: GTPase Era [Tistrella]|jgi:GTP-binding protein Era|uniref:GTPase Era n=1 Tax=Tistrella arctica TaxID=3133430 RepID=A0ABU9YF57_9PROT